MKTALRQFIRIALGRDPCWRRVTIISYRSRLGDFDLSLADYFGGIPTSIKSAAHHFAFDFPPAPTGQEDPMAEFRAMGVNSVDLDFNLGMHRDVSDKSMVLDDLAVSGIGLGSAYLSGTIGNVDDQLFTGDQASVIQAATGLTIRRLKFNLTDEGLANLIFKPVAAAQHVGVSVARAATAAMAEQMVTTTLGDATEVGKLADAVGQFIGGRKSLSVAVTTDSPTGLGLPDLFAAQSDPKVLVNQLSIEATAK